MDLSYYPFFFTCPGAYGLADCEPVIFLAWPGGSRWAGVVLTITILRVQLVLTSNAINHVNAKSFVFIVLNFSDYEFFARQL